MRRPVLYMGDGSLGGAARYLAGVMRSAGIRFDHVPSQSRFGRRDSVDGYGLFIFSDYPAHNLTEAAARRIAALVEGGRSLLMIGGWASFHGSEGRYADTPIGEILPVVCQRRDDRQQGAAAYRIVNPTDATEFAALDFTGAPSICGYNRTRVKPGARQILEVETLAFETPTRRCLVTRRDPLLVLGTRGAGTVAALTTDLAPHWAGGLLDWGPRRTVVTAAPGVHAEVGRTYVRFVQRLIDLVNK